MRLFCLPYAGGTTRMYRPWLDRLRPDVELVALDLAGRGTRTAETRPESLAAAADDLACRVESMAGGDEYALYGHSMGAVLAYEITLRLGGRRAHGPRHLFAAACRPPGRHRGGSPLHVLPDEAFLGAMVALGGVPAEFLAEPDTVRFYAEMIRADYRLYEEHCETAKPRTIQTPISVIVGAEDPIVPVTIAEAWSTVTTEPVTTKILPGAGHFFDAEQTAQAADHVSKVLEKPVEDSFVRLLGRLRHDDVLLTVAGSQLRYSAPAGVVDDALAAAMKRHKPRLLEHLSAHGQGEVEASGPASQGQRRSVRRLAITERPEAFNIAIRLSITGALDVPAMNRAITALIARHGALRTRLVRYGRYVVQERLRPGPVELTIVDLSAMATAQPDAADEWAAKQARRGFALGEAPLLRATAAWLADRRWELMLVLQHTVGDGWSVATILNDLSVLYRTGGTTAGSALQPLQTDYLGFAKWEERHYSGERLERLLRQWEPILHGAPLTFRLVYDRPSPAELSGRGGLHDFWISPELAARVGRLAGTLATTPFAVYFAAFVCWLAGLTAAHDLTVPVNYANRPHRRYEDVVGFFVDNVPVRVVLKEDEPFVDLVRRVGHLLVEATDRFVPFEILQRSVLTTAKDHERFPQIPFVMLNTPPLQASLQDLAVTVSITPVDGAKYELSFILAPDGDGWRAHVPYQTDLFDATTISRWCQGYLDLLSSRVPDDPDGQAARPPVFRRLG